MKYEIMMSILFDLLTKKVVTATYLAEKYEVSIRSIYRYVQAIEMAGVPIYTNRGNKGGISIVDTFRLSSTFLTQAEFEITIKTLSAFLENLPDKNLESAINKIKAIRKNQADNFNIKSGNLIIDAGPWGDTIGYKNKIAVINKSIETNKKLQINYHDRNGDITERIIEPHIVVFKQGLWYVFAFCNLRNEFRLFKIGRIESANILDDTFIRRETDEVEQALKFWQDEINSIDVKLEIDKKYKSDAEEWLGIESISEKDGKIIAQSTLPFDGGLISKIMSFGEGITVLSPTELKNKVIERAQQLLENYK